MELAAKGDLLDLVEKQNRLEVDDSRRIFRSIVNGVKHMHAHEVIHRDLKLENIFLTDED